MIAGERVPLIWSEGRPALAATVQARKDRAPFAVRLVLDSGIDHAVLFGKLADAVSRNGLSAAVAIETAFGSRIAGVASVKLGVAGRDRRLDVGADAGKAGSR